MKSHHRAFYSISFILILVGLVAFFAFQYSQARRVPKVFSGFIRSFDPNTQIIFVSSLTPETDPLLSRFTLSTEASITTLVSPNSVSLHKVSYEDFIHEFIRADTRLANFPFDFEAEGSVITKMTERYTQ